MYIHIYNFSSFSHHFGTTLGSLWDHFGVTLGSFWGHVGGHPGVSCGIIVGSFWGDFGVIIINIIKSICSLTFGRGFGGQVEAQNVTGEVEKLKN